jgi:hypothetical protein
MTIDSNNPDGTTASETGPMAFDIPYRSARPSPTESLRRDEVTDYAEYVRDVLDDDDERGVTDREYVRTVIRQSRSPDLAGRPLFSSVVGDRVDEVR